MTAYDHEPTPAERGDYWVAVHTWIFQVEGLTRTALDTYIGLASYADRAGVAWPSVQAVADRMRMSASSVRRGITELESLGILTRVPAYIEGRQVSNRYQIRMTAPEPLAPARPIDDGRGGTVWQIDDDTDTPPNHDDRGGCQDDRGGCQPDTPGLSRGQGGGVTLTDRTPPENTTREHHQGTSGRAGARDTPAAVTGTESKPAKRGTRIPTRFTITDEMIQWAVEHVPGQACGLSDTELKYPWVYTIDTRFVSIAEKLRDCKNPKIAKMIDKTKPLTTEEALHDAVHWETQIIYSWQQTFKAGAITRVKHSYQPLVGGGVHFSEVEYQDYCIGNAVKKAIAGSESKDMLPYSSVGYILSTGANWAKPIANFKLTVERDNDEVVSFCWAGKSHVVNQGNGVFTITEKNFTPTKELDVVFLKVR